MKLTKYSNFYITTTCILLGTSNHGQENQSAKRLVDTQFQMLKGLSFGAFHLMTLAVPEDPLTLVSFSGSLGANPMEQTGGPQLWICCVSECFFSVEGGSKRRGHFFNLKSSIELLL